MAPPESNIVISKKLVAVNALSLVTSRVLTIGVMLWVNRHLLTRLDQTQYAPYPTAVAVVLILQVLTFGLTAGMLRHVTEAYAKGDRERITQLVSSMVPLIYGTTSLFLAGGLFLAWHIDSLAEVDPAMLGDARLMMTILVGSHAFTLLLTPYSSGLHVRQKFSWIALIRIGGLLLQTGVLVALLFGVDTRVLWVVVASEVANVLIAVVTCVLSRRMIPELRFRFASVRRETACELCSFGAWSMLGYLLYRIRTSADVLILGNLGTGTSLSRTVFHLGTMPERQLDRLLGPAAAAIDPALTAMHASDDDRALQQAYLRGNRLYLWLVLAVTMPVIVFAHDLVRLYVGEALILAAPVAIYICLRYPLSYSSEMLYRVCMAKAKIREFYVILSLSATVKLAVVCVLVGIYDLGAVGAAAGTLAVAAVTITLFLWPLGLRMVDMRFGKYLRETLLPGWTPAGAAGLIGYGMSWLVPANTWLRVFLDIGVMFAVHCATVWIVSRPEDRRDFAAVCGRVKQALGGSAPASA